jgi:hypothetical protein
VKASRSISDGSMSERRIAVSLADAAPNIW